MRNKILKIIFSVAISFLILGGVFDQLNQYQEKQIRKSAIEKLSEKTVKSTTYLLDNISKSLSSQSKNKESGNATLQMVNFFINYFIMNKLRIVLCNMSDFSIR